MGLAELNQALARTDRGIRREVRKELRSVAVPVQRTAQQLLREEPPVGIRNIGLDWSKMRVGITYDTVYVAPRKRGLKRGTRKRPNLAPLMLDRMEQALEQHADRIEQRFLDAVDRVADNFSG